MACLPCKDLNRVFTLAYKHYDVARNSSFYLVSTEIAACMQVDMERARTALFEHQEACKYPVVLVNPSVPATPRNQEPI